MRKMGHIASRGGLRLSFLAPVVGLALCFGLAAAPRQAYADEQDLTSNPEYAAALERLNSIADEYSALAQEQSDTLTQLEDVRKQISDNEEQISGVEDKIATSKNELTEMKGNLASHIASDYKSGGVSLLSIMLSSDSFEDAISRMHYHSVICSRQVDEIGQVNAKKQELQSQQDELKRLKNDLEGQEDSLEDLYGQQQQQTAAMQAQQYEASEYLNSLSAELQASLAKEDEELLGSAQAVAEEAGTNEQDAATSDDGKDAADSASNEGTSGDAQKTDANASSNSNAGKSNGNGSSSNSNASKTDTKTSTNTSKPSTPAPSKPTTTQGGGGTQQRVLDACYSTGGAEPLNNGWGCAGWVYCVFRNSGVYNRKPRCAAWYYENWCYTSDRSQLQPGMVIAVSTWTGTAAGKIYGHVGIYVGNNTVRHLSAGAVREMSVDKWIKQYGTTVTPMWGWNGGIALS